MVSPPCRRISSRISMTATELSSELISDSLRPEYTTSMNSVNSLRYGSGSRGLVIFWGLGSGRRPEVGSW